MFDPYGKVTVLDGNGTPRTVNESLYGNTKFHQGLRLDTETGLYYNRARMLDPVLGRFIGRDPIGYEGSKWGLYEYVNSRPVVHTDPFGKTPQGIAAVGAVLIGIVKICMSDLAEYTNDTYPDAGDSFRHCYASCRIARRCGAPIAQLAGLGKEAKDRAIAAYCELFPDSDICKDGHGSFWDSVDDLMANQKCITWETNSLLGAWIGDLIREDCECCCKREVGYKTGGRD